jgi:hypothetical protein
MNELSLFEKDIYRPRFGEKELARDLRRSICRHLKPHVDPNGNTLDLGARYCQLINNIGSREKLALHSNGGNLRRHSNKEVRHIVSSASDLEETVSNSVNRVFARRRGAQLPGGLSRHASGWWSIVPEPHFDYCAMQYYDLFDHRLTIARKALAEGWRSAAFNWSELRRAFCHTLRRPVRRGRLFRLCSAFWGPRCCW